MFGRQKEKINVSETFLKKKEKEKLSVLEGSNLKKKNHYLSYYIDHTSHQFYIPNMLLDYA